MWITINDTHKLYKSYAHSYCGQLVTNKLPESYPQSYTHFPLRLAFAFLAT